MSLNGFRSRVRSFFLGRRKSGAPILMTEWGPVNEAARKQAALNMKADPEVRRRVETFLAKELGSLAKGLAEARRRYPEGYED